MWGAESPTSQLPNWRDAQKIQHCSPTELSRRTSSLSPGKQVYAKFTPGFLVPSRQVPLQPLNRPGSNANPQQSNATGPAAAPRNSFVPFFPGDSWSASEVPDCWRRAGAVLDGFDDPPNLRETVSIKTEKTCWTNRNC